MKTTRSRTVLAASMVAALALAACSNDESDSGSGASETTAAAAEATTTVAPTETTVSGEPTKPVEIEADIVGTALGAEVFTQLAGLVVDAGLVEPLRGDDLTVFAPTDDAFAAVPDETMDAVHADKDLMTAVLTYHVVPGVYTTADLKDGDELTTLQGSTLKISVKGDKYYVNDVEIVAPDVQATNGVIHVIGSVLVPSS